MYCIQKGNKGAMETCRLETRKSSSDSAEAVLHQAYQCMKHKECKYAKAKTFAEGDSFDKIVNTMDSAGCLTVTL